MAESSDIDVRRLLEILQLFGDLQQGASCVHLEEPKRRLLTAAIDFGTTFSGYAFSFTSDKDDIRMNKNWGSESGFQLHKTETSVLLNPNREFVAFGSEASKAYTELDESDAKKHYYFHRFKMKLHTEKTLSQDTTLEDVNGKKLPALDIFAHAIRYLKDHMLGAIKLTVSPDDVTLRNDDIRWVLTVPAIWDDRAKQFMRQAAYKAGIASDSNQGQLMIALEPEAAGIFCRCDKTQQKFVDIKPVDRYMIVDCGGGTVDITVYETGEDSKVKEVTTASGGDWGGTKVDEEFLKLLDDIFGADIMTQYKVEHPNEYLILLNDFEIKKRSTRYEDSGEVAVILGYNFHQFYPKHKDDRTVQQAIKQYNSDQVRFTNGMIKISHFLMTSLFKNVIDSILHHLNQLLTQGEVTPLKYMFMVGGFSESPILQHAIKEKFQGLCDVIVPEGCSLAIVRGAVMFGHDTSSIAARKSKYTYGTGVCVPFDPEHHPKRLKKWIDGKLLCTVFAKFVEAGQLVAVGEVSEHVFTPASIFQQDMGIEILRTEKKEVHYCDEEGVIKCGYVTVTLPPLLSGQTRAVRATLTFADTEIKVDAFAFGTGERQSTKIDFMHL